MPIAFHLTLLAKDKIGYHNLCKLSSIGYTEGFYYYPRVDFETLAQYKEGLICLSGCIESPIAHKALTSSRDTLVECAKEYHALTIRQIQRLLCMSRLQTKKKTA